MNDVLWLSLGKDIPTGPGVYWDTTLIEELLKGCSFHYRIGNLKKAIVIIPGANSGKHIRKINSELARLDSCVVIITSDEENKFPIDKLEHPNMRVFANYYNKKYKSDIRWLPIGPASLPKLDYTQKSMDWFFAGQINHPSREKLAKRLKEIPKGTLLKTSGFAQGYSKAEYYEFTARSKSVPAPNGFISPDSFRFYEALEVGAVPIPEAPSYWKHLFSDMPMVAVKSWRDLDKEINYIAENHAYRNECVAWWQRTKLDIKDEIMGVGEVFTVVIPVSPIASHPSTNILDGTIESVRKQLPQARIILTFDGVREEQASRADAYNEFISRVLWKYNNDNVYPMTFKDHTHQVGMAREALKHVKTPTLVYVEQDTPFTEEPIPWYVCEELIQKGVYDLIRFHFESHIPEPHQHMMLGLKRQGTIPFMKTCQWSQRPHIASVSFYDRILNDNFSEDANSFIEDKMHGVCHNSYLKHGEQGWHNYRLAIFHPLGSIQRSFHTDGRAGEAKYDETQVF